MKIMRSKIDKMILEEVIMLEENISMEQLRAVYERDFKRPPEPNAQDPEGHAEVRFEMFANGFFDGQASEKSETGQIFFGANADWSRSQMNNPMSEDYLNGYDYATKGKADAHAAQAQDQSGHTPGPGRERIASHVPELPVREASMRVAKSRVKEIIQEELDRFNTENF